MSLLGKREKMLGDNAVIWVLLLDDNLLCYSDALGLLEEMAARRYQVKSARPSTSPI